MSVKMINRKQRSQQGMVSIMVTMIMMLVISLIVLGFAQVSRREQRQTLDRNLSVQAFLAAESGVNDALDAIRNAPAGTSIEKPDCPVKGVKYINKDLNPTIDSANDVAYTCMIVQTGNLPNITAKVPADGGSSIFPLHPGNGTIDTVHISWTLNSNPSDVNGCNNSRPASAYFTNTSVWTTCPYGVLRLDIVPTDTYQRAAMDAGQKTIFFYPTKNGPVPQVAYGSADGSVQSMACKPQSCRADIIGVGGSTNYSVRAMAIYTAGNIEITAEGGGSALTLKDAQAQIDVTGRAQDVLRRIQVRIPLTPNKAATNYAIESASAICKRFKTGDNTFAIPTGIQGQDQNNPMCKVSSTGP
jgi:hypothetical protein